MSPTRTASTPWGLPADLIDVGKQHVDPVYGLFVFSRLEWLLIDGPLQRLDGIYQLGSARQAFRSATHTRLSHVMGTAAWSQKLLDLMIHPLYNPNGPEGLFAEWAAEGRQVFERRCREATILARLGGLTHDLCHVSRSHVLEDVFGVRTPHDQGRRRFQILWDGLGEHFDGLARKGRLSSEQLRALSTLLDGDLYENLVPMIIGRESGMAAERERYPWVPALEGNTFCADALDYVERDYHFTGESYALDGHWVRQLTVTGSQSRYPQRVALRVTRKGEVRPEVIRSLVNFLDARRHLFYAAYQNPRRVTPSNSMFAKAVELWIQHLEMQGRGEQVDRLLLELGDDALIWYLSRLETFEGDRFDSEEARRRVAAISMLANGVRTGDLFKVTATCKDRRAAADLRRRLAVRGSRLALEGRIAQAAGVDPNHVILWVPPPEMWGKRCEDVLVQVGTSVVPILESPWAERVKQPALEHRQSWAAHLLVHPDVPRPTLELLRTTLVRATEAPWVPRPRVFEEEVSEYEAPMGRIGDA